MLADMATISAEVSYIEIGVSNASKSRVFLEQMFGWKFHPFGEGAEGWFQTPTIKAGVLRCLGPRSSDRRCEPLGGHARGPN